MDAKVPDQVAVGVKSVRVWWLQFSLRTLLILTTVLCCGLGWIVPRAHRQQAVVRELIKRQGNCLYRIYETYTSQGKKFPAWYSLVYDSPFLDYFDTIVECKIPVKKQDDLAFLNQLSELHTLRVVFQKKESLINASQLLAIPSLRTLRLSSANPDDHVVPPEIIAGVGQLSQLKSIDLHYAAMSEQGLKQIKTFVFIEELQLSKKQVSNLDVKILQSLPRLTKLHIDWVNAGSKNHQELREELQKALPKCQVTVSGGWICG
jgi:hypothetical protein